MISMVLKQISKITMMQNMVKISDRLADELGLALVVNMSEITLKRIGDDGIN
jgi:hypothetical protein